MLFRSSRYYNSSKNSPGVFFQEAIVSRNDTVGKLSLHSDRLRGNPQDYTILCQVFISKIFQARYWNWLFGNITVFGNGPDHKRIAAQPVPAVFQYLSCFNFTNCFHYYFSTVCLLLKAFLGFCLIVENLAAFCGAPLGPTPVGTMI